MTGLRSADEAAAGQTFRYRQSSSIPGEPGRSTETSHPPTPAGWIHPGPYVSAFRTSLQGATDCGARQRHGPTGGAANGIPLNTRTPLDVGAALEIEPASILTPSGRRAGTEAEVAKTRSAALMTVAVQASRPFDNLRHLTGTRYRFSSCARCSACEPLRRFASA